VNGKSRAAQISIAFSAKIVTLREKTPFYAVLSLHAGGLTNVQDKSMICSLRAKRTRSEFVFKPNSSMIRYL
jgi:hypothetical protein